MTVLDASIVVAVLLKTPGFERIKSRLGHGEQDFHAPHLLDVEVIHVVRRFWLASEIDDLRAQEAIADLTSFPIRRHPHTPFASRVWELRHNMTAYDALYVALSEGLNATLLTCDKRLAEQAGKYITVETFD